MTALELAKRIGVSRALVYKYQRKYPSEVPASFEAVVEWRKFVEAHRAIATPKRSAKLKLSTQDWNAIFVQHRALEKEANAELKRIQLDATKRQILTQAEVLEVFGKLGTVLRGKLMKLKNDIPASCAGLNEVGIEEVASQRFDEVLNSFELPADLFEAKSVVS